MSESYGEILHYRSYAIALVLVVAERECGENGKIEKHGIRHLERIIFLM